MEYLVFPFGKYKGEKLKDLPSTYIVLALEKFDLPFELKESMSHILLGRFEIYSQFKDTYSNMTKKDFEQFLKDRITNYEKNNQDG